MMNDYDFIRKLVKDLKDKYGNEDFEVFQFNMSIINHETKESRTYDISSNPMGQGNEPINERVTTTIRKGGFDCDC